MCNSEEAPYALPYRLRSARQKKRSQKEDVEKQLIQLWKQRAKLWIERQKLPWVPLAEPYQRGWKRFFVLREDVKRCNDAVFYQGLLEKINTVQHSRDKAFKVKKRRKRRNEYEVKRQSLREFDISEWNSPKLALTEKEKSFFCRMEYWCGQSKYWKVRYVYTEPWRFVLQIKPHIITHVRLVDAQLEQESPRIENYIERNHLNPKILKLTNGRRSSWKKYTGTNPKYSHPFKNIPLHMILNSCLEEKTEQQ
jgi:hypothetical protein